MQAFDAELTKKGAVATRPAAETEPPAAGYEAVRFNAMQHGILSHHTVPAHEDPEEYWMLLAALVEDQQPAAATEAHLAEELAGIAWRKRWVLQAEGANISKGLEGATAMLRTSFRRRRHSSLGYPGRAPTCAT